VLHVPGGGGGAAAVDLASRIAGARADVEVLDVVVEDEAIARAGGFRGSSTILTDGQDLEPDTEIPPGSMG
jgi:hypothetical protein